MSRDLETTSLLEAIRDTDPDGVAYRLDNEDQVHYIYFGLLLQRAAKLIEAKDRANETQAAVIKDLETTLNGLRDQVDFTAGSDARISAALADANAWRCRYQESLNAAYTARRAVVRSANHRVRRWKFYAGLAIAFSLGIAIVSGFSHYN
jgi:hypothetical protein